MHALTKNLAIELAPYKIRVNAIAPVLPTFNAMHPLGRNGQPADRSGEFHYRRGAVGRQRRHGRPAVTIGGRSAQSVTSVLQRITGGAKRKQGHHVLRSNFTVHTNAEKCRGMA